MRDRHPTQLSGGQQPARRACARAIVCEPHLILLDEPLAALDARLRRQMQVFLKQIQRRIETTFVFVTHDQEEAITMSDRIVVMSQGRIEQVGTPKDLYYRPANPLRRRILRRQQSDRRRGGGVRRSHRRRKLGTFPLAKSATAGRRILVAIRPENPCGLAHGTISIPADVEEVMFGGAMTRILLHADCGARDHIRS